jgi:hypothetical protein
MEALRHAADQAKAGHGQIVATMAEAGTGAWGNPKSIREFNSVDQGCHGRGGFRW